MVLFFYNDCVESNTGHENMMVPWYEAMMIHSNKIS